MSTHVTTQNLVRDDVTGAPQAGSATASTRPGNGGRGWALAGIGAGLCGMATIVTSSLVDAVYDPDLAGDPAGIAAKLSEQTTAMYVFHAVTALGAVLMLVFAAGLHRRLKAVLPDSIVPTVALSGLLGTAFVSIMGSGLDTEFTMALQNGDPVSDSSAVMYNHWIGTIPWLWTLSGMTGLALFAAYRRGGVPRWIGIVGLVLGGLTVLLGISPLEYMAGVTGTLWLVVTAIGFTVGDRAFSRTHRTA